MKKIPMLDLKREYEYMKDDIDSTIRQCLDHQQWIFGPEIKQLEDALSAHLGVAHCVGTSSGTEALVLSLRALAIKLRGQEYFDMNDEIITTPLTFTATGDAILRSGATPVFIDIDPVTYNIDPFKVREYLSQNAPRVIGIVPVHLYGRACHMDEIMDMARQYNLFVVEDVAQAFGGKWKGRNLGSMGTTGAFSFFPSKNLGGFGDGGMTSTDDDEIAEIVRMLIKHGGRDKYNVDHIGYNARLDTLQAAIILTKFKYIDDFNGRRRNIAEHYTKGLENIAGLSIPVSTSLSSVHHVYNQYTIRVLDGKRNALQDHLKAKNISTMVYYPVPLHQMKIFQGKDRKGNPPCMNAEKAVREVLSLPVEPLQDEEDTQYVVDCIREYFSNAHS